MNCSHAALPFEIAGPITDEISSLAWKFHLDNPRCHATDHRDRLCAEYLLAQKELIQYRLAALHRYR